MDIMQSSYLLNYLFISSLICTVWSNASLKKADYNYSFWLYEVQKNPNLSLIDRRVYEFDNFAASLPLQNQTVLYEQLKVQLKFLIEHLNELCKDSCMQQACKSSSDIEFYVVKDWSMFARMKFQEMPFVPKKETVYNVKNQIEYVQDRLQALSYAFCPMISSY